MALTKEDKARVVLEHGKSEKNTGSTEAQVALLRIAEERVLAPGPTGLHGGELGLAPLRSVRAVPPVPGEPERLRRRSRTDVHRAPHLVRAEDACEGLHQRDLSVQVGFAGNVAREQDGEIDVADGRGPARRRRGSSGAASPPRWPWCSGPWPAWCWCGSRRAGDPSGRWR